MYSWFIVIVVTTVIPSFPYCESLFPTLNIVTIIALTLLFTVSSMSVRILLLNPIHYVYIVSISYVLYIHVCMCLHRTALPLPYSLQKNLLLKHIIKHYEVLLRKMCFT